MLLVTSWKPLWAGKIMDSDKQAVATTKVVINCKFRDKMLIFIFFISSSIIMHLGIYAYCFCHCEGVPFRNDRGNLAI